MNKEQRERYNQTGPSSVGDGIILVRGHDIRKVIKDFTFEDSLYFQVVGKMPNDETRQTLRSALISNTNVSVPARSSYTKTVISGILELEEQELSSFDSFPKGLELLVTLLHNLPRFAAIQLGRTISDEDDVETFEQYIFSTILGRMPNDKEERLMQAYLVSLCEHGDTSPSTPGAQIISNLRGNFYQAAITFMLSADTPFHFGALPLASAQLKDIHNGNSEEYVQVKLEKVYPENVIYGFGHRYHKTTNFIKVTEEEKSKRAESIDPRVAVLAQIGEELGFESGFFKQVKDIGKLLYQRKSIPINIDGIGAGILLDAGFSPDIVLTFVYLGRLPMIARHFVTQQKTKANTLWTPGNDTQTITVDFSNAYKNNTAIKNYKTKRIPDTDHHVHNDDLEAGLGDDSYGG